MPLLWSYLLSSYCRVFALCLVAIVLILLTMRLEEIISFVILGPHLGDILWFILLQIPLILPIAMPISALVAATWLMKSLSVGHELTALRASGLSLGNIISPMLICALFLSLVNFYAISELSTSSHSATHILRKELRSISPLHVLHNKNFLKVKGAYFDVRGASALGEYVQDAIFLAPSKSEGRLHLLVAKELQTSDAQFIGHQVTVLTGKYDAVTGNETLVVENIGRTDLAIADLAEFFDPGSGSSSQKEPRFQDLVLALKEAQQTLRSENPVSSYRTLYRQLYLPLIEMIRRFSIGLSVFSFTLLGLVFGIAIGRNQSNRNLYLIIILSTLTLMSFFIGKGYNDRLWPAMGFYLTPHLVIGIAGYWMLRRIAYGVE